MGDHDPDTDKLISYEDTLPCQHTSQAQAHLWGGQWEGTSD